MSKYGVISGPYFPVFSPKTGKYGPEITPYLDTFHGVIASFIQIEWWSTSHSVYSLITDMEF